MAEYLIKICFQPNKTCYKNCVDFRDLKSKVMRDIFPQVVEKNVRFYWIDDEDDDIEISDQESFEIFLMQNKDKKKIFVENSSGENSDGEDKTKLPEGIAIHTNIICDGCEVNPIIGYRYKCVQCPNYDLCMKCEGNMIHSEHVMFRLPAPSGKIYFDRHILKKMKRGQFGRRKDDPECSYRGRHTYGHHSGHGGRHTNIFSNLYTMMHDMAEGTEGPTEPDTTEARQNTEQCGKKHEKYCKRQKSEEKKQSKEPKESPTFPTDDPAFNPKYANVFVEIASNLNDIIGKILDPIGVNVEVDIGGVNSKSSNDKATENKETANPQETKVKKDENNAENRNSEPVPETSQAGDKQSYILINDTAECENPELKKTDEPKVAEFGSEEGKIIPSAPVELRDQPGTSDESEWTLIDKQSEEKKSLENEKATALKSDSDDDNKSISSENNYIKLSQELWQHIQREEAATVASMKQQQQQQQKEQQQQQQQEQQAPVETRAQIVFHKKKHINDAIISMIGMGFSNEGNYLTALLESVDGDIPKALDLFQPTI